MKYRIIYVLLFTLYCFLGITLDLLTGVESYAFIPLIPWFVWMDLNLDEWEKYECS